MIRRPVSGGTKQPPTPTYILAYIFLCLDDKTAYLSNVQISSGGKAAKDIIVDFLARPSGGTLEKVLTFSIADTGQSIERSLRSAPKKMTEKTDIEMRAIASASGSSDISADFDLILVDN